MDFKGFYWAFIIDSCSILKQCISLNPNVKTVDVITALLHLLTDQHQSFKHGTEDTNGD